MSEDSSSIARRPSRRLAVILALAVAVIVAADLAVTAVGGHLQRPLYWPTWEIQHKYDELATAGQPYSVVFFGDSVPDSAIDPSLMTALPGGAYNASLAGEPLPVVADWARRIVVPKLHPATVVLCFGINVLSDPGNDQAALIQQFNRSRPVAVAEGRGSDLDHLDGWLHAHIGLFRYRTVLRQPFAQSAAGGAAIYDPPLTSLGWNQGFQAGVQSAAAAAFDQNEATYQIDPARLTLIGDLVRELRAQVANVVVVMMPVSHAYLPALPGGRPTYERALAGMTQEARTNGATVLQAGEWSNRDFADAAHLNRAGTVRFSTWVADKLAGLG